VSDIKNFLISIKEDTFLEETNKWFFWSSESTIKESQGCLVGLEYVLSDIYNQELKIEN
jgi:hypothetical protein